jgi:hypothetical protein
MLVFLPHGPDWTNLAQARFVQPAGRPGRIVPTNLKILEFHKKNAALSRP